MSSLRNVVKRRTYKERSQPKRREHLGLLEKHRDYAERARNYEGKQKRLKAMREKAAARNPEEFYFGMVHERTKGGVHKASTGQRPLPMRTARALKAQDHAYLQHKGGKEAKRADRLRGALHGLGERPPDSHTIFVQDEAQAEAFDPAAHFGTAPELADRTFNRPRTEMLARADVVVPRAVREALGDDDEELAKWAGRVARHKELAYEEYAQRSQRRDALAREAGRLAQERALFGKGAKKRRVVTVEDGTKKVVHKWKKERKR